MTARVKVSTFFVGAVVVALALAFFLSPEASGEPDGLERVAIDEGFIDTADDHALADLPTADYAVEGIDDERFSTGLAGIIGVTVTLGVTAGITWLVRRRPPAADTR